MTDYSPDEELLTAVHDFGEEREPGDAARATAMQMDDEGQPDLRGVRDRDPHAPNPWRSL